MEHDVEAVAGEGGCGRRLEAGDWSEMAEKMLPELTENGDLPIGIHPVGWRECYRTFWFKSSFKHGKRNGMVPSVASWR